MGQLVLVGEGRLSLAFFERRWRQQAREEGQGKPAPPARPLPACAVGTPRSCFAAQLSVRWPSRTFVLQGKTSPPPLLQGLAMGGQAKVVKAQELVNAQTEPFCGIPAVPCPVQPLRRDGALCDPACRLR